MDQLNKLFAGFAAAAMLASCSGNEPTVTPNPGGEDNGEVAYMTISIKAPETGSRATTDGGYEPSDATEKEHSVKNVDFLFFDATGTYVFTVKADDTKFIPADDTKPNVEYVNGGNTILILNGIDKSNYPEYVMTILNAPADFTPGSDIAETGTRLTAMAADFPANSESPFVMTTSSFLGNKNGASGEVRHDSHYSVTKLNESDFHLTAQEAKDSQTPVEIYVERLASKVEVTLAGNVTEIAGKKVYKISQTLAGGDNNTSGDAVSDVDLYISVDGWRLNATANQSYMSKQLDAGWATTAPFAGWNIPDDWRSFWGKAYTYGADLEGKLFYETPKNLTANPFGFDGTNQGNVQYCYENTNFPDDIFTDVNVGMEFGDRTVAVQTSKVTHVALLTNIWQLGADGTSLTAPSLVQFQGIVFTETAYKNMLLNQLKNAGNLNFWRYTGSSTDPTTDITTENWKTVSSDDFEMVRDESEGHKVGQVKIVAKTLAAADKIYKRVEKDGTVSFEDITATYKATVDNLLANLNGDKVAVGSNSGTAIYYIPVEHLAATGNQAIEGYYGVVRNHWYKISINSFKRIGHLVFEPETDDTPLIPDDPDDSMFYVGANVNILSWKVVNQNVSDL